MMIPAKRQRFRWRIPTPVAIISWQVTLLIILPVTTTLQILQSPAITSCSAINSSTRVRWRRKLTPRRIHRLQHMIRTPELLLIVKNWLRWTMSAAIIPAVRVLLLIMKMRLSPLIRIIWVLLTIPRRKLTTPTVALPAARD